MTAGEPVLVRRLGFVLLTLYGLGVTIGAGIYVLIGKVAGTTGVFMPLAFLAAAVLAGVTALSFAELSVRYPRSAGEALYVREGFRSEALSVATGLMVALIGIVASAAVAVGAAGYIAQVVPLPEPVLIAVIVVVLTGLAAWGIHESVLAAGIVTVIEIAGLVLVVAVAAPEMPGLGERLSSAGAAEVFTWGGFTAGVLLCFFAFAGFEDMVNVVEEVREPQRTMPWAIVATLALTAVIYVLVALAALAVATPAELAASDAPLALVFERATGITALPLVAIASLATLNGVVILTVMASRVLYGLSRQGSIPAVLGRVNARTHTPVVATLLVGAAILVLALAVPLGLLAEAVSVIILVVFSAVNLALGLIKLRDKGAAPPFQMPGFWPWLAFAISLAVLVADAARRLT
jgi:amino acid transporter